jgi:hypothetical protein
MENPTAYILLAVVAIALCVGVYRTFRAPVVEDLDQLRKKDIGDAKLNLYRAEKEAEHAKANIALWKARIARLEAANTAATFGNDGHRAYT